MTIFFIKNYIAYFINYFNNYQFMFEIIFLCFNLCLIIIMMESFNFKNLLNFITINFKLHEYAINFKNFKGYNLID